MTSQCRTDTCCDRPFICCLHGYSDNAIRRCSVHVDRLQYLQQQHLLCSLIVLKGSLNPWNLPRGFPCTVKPHQYAISAIGKVWSLVFGQILDVWDRCTGSPYHGQTGRVVLGKHLQDRPACITQICFESNHSSASFAYGVHIGRVYTIHTKVHPGHSHAYTVVK